MPNGCYVYAIVDRRTPLPTNRVPEISTELTMVPWRELAAVTGTPRAEDSTVTIDAVRRHEAVVEAVRRQGPALPVRFGTVFANASSVASAVAERYELLAADLGRLGDKVELSLTALWTTLPDGDEPAESPLGREAPGGRGAGARYLQGRAAEFRRGEALKARARAVARELDASLGGRALARRVSFLPTQRIAVRATYLLDPAEVDNFKAAFEATLRTSDEVRTLLTGPWPPYSFVGRTETEGAAPAESRFAELAQLVTSAMRGRLG